MKTGNKGKKLPETQYDIIHNNSSRAKEKRKEGVGSKEVGEVFHLIKCCKYSNSVDGCQAAYLIPFSQCIRVIPEQS